MIRSLLSIAALAVVAMASAVELIKDGGFEAAPAGAQPGGRSFDGFWTVGVFTDLYSGFTIDKTPGDVITGTASVQFVDVALSQTLATIPNQICTVSFDAYADTFSGNSSLIVSFGPSTFTLVVPGLSTYNPLAPVSHFSYTAVPTSTSTVLNFVSSRTTVELDNVSVTQAVPEPAPLAALGLGALVLVRRRKGGMR